MEIAAIVNDKPSLRETVGCAVNSSNLKSDDLKEGAVDRVASMARADALGSALWRVKVGGDMSALAPAALLLSHRVANSEEFPEWGMDDHLKLLRICKRVLNEWLQDKCTQCKGRGRTGMGKGKVEQGSVACQVCNGSGRVAHVGQISAQLLATGKATYGRHYRFKGQVRTKAQTIEMKPDDVIPQTRPCLTCAGVGKIKTEKSIKEASLGKLCGRCEGSGRARINGAERAKVVGVSRQAYWQVWDARFMAIRQLLAEADGEAGEDIRTALRGPREERTTVGSS